MALQPSAPRFVDQRGVVMARTVTTTVTYPARVGPGVGATSTSWTRAQPGQYLRGLPHFWCTRGELPRS